MSVKLAFGIILVLTIIVTQINIINGQDDSSCVGKPCGWKFQDPLDCHGYYVCLEGKVYQAYCDHSEKFDEDTKKCVVGKCPPCKKCNTDCPASTTPPPLAPSSSTPAPPTPAPPTPAPPTPTPPTPAPPTPAPPTPTTDSCNDRPHGDMWRNPYNCEQFYVCSWGISTLHHCPGDLQFNDYLKVCDWPQNVNCNLNNPTPSSSTPAPTTSTPAPPTPAPPTPTPSTPAPATPGPPTQVPPTPAPPTPAPPTPAPPTPAPPTPAPPTPATPPPATLTPAPPTPTPQTPAPPTTAPGSCFNRPHGDKWRDPYNCDQFYVCSWGVSTLHHCPGGLQFNENLKVCDWPQNVDCTRKQTSSWVTSIPTLPSTTTTVETTTTPATTTARSTTASTTRTSSTTTSPATTTISTTTTSSTTPAAAMSTVKDGQVDLSITDCLGKINGTRFRSSTNCRVYYQCRTNQAVKSSCSEGLWFDDRAYVCNFRSSVNCPANVD